MLGLSSQLREAESERARAQSQVRRLQKAPAEAERGDTCPPPAPGHGHFPGVSRCAQAWAVGQHHPAGPPEPGRGGGLLGSTSPSQGGEVQRRRGALLPRWALLVRPACGPTTGRAARPPITSPRSPALLVTPAAFLSAPHLCVTLGTGPGPRYWKEGRGEESGDLHPKEGGQGLLEGAPRGPPIGASRRDP